MVYQTLSQNLGPYDTRNLARPDLVVRFPVVKTIIAKGLTDEDAGVREASIAVVARQGFPALLELLDDKSADVRVAALERLEGLLDGGISVPAGALSAFAKLAENDPDPAIRCRSLRLCGNRFKTEAERILLRALGDRELAVRIEGCRLLGEIEAVTALPDLVKLLENDRDPSVRVAAIEGLGAIGHRRAIPFLEKAAKEDGSEDVRKKASEVLRNLMEDEE